MHLFIIGLWWELRAYHIRPAMRLAPEDGASVGPVAEEETDGGLRELSEREKILDSTYRSSPRVF